MNLDNLTHTAAVTPVAVDQPLVVAAAVTLGAVCAVAGIYIARLASRRSAAQPLMVDVAAERVVVATVLTRPELYSIVCTLTPDDFAEPTHRDLWAAIEDTLGADTVRDAVKRAGLSHVDTLPTDDIIARLSATGRSIDTSEVRGAVETIAGIDADTGEASTSPDELFTAGGTVAACADDRGRLGGAGLTEATGDRDTPLRRVVTAPSRARTATTAALCGAGGALTPIFAFDALNGSVTSWALAVGALVALTCVGALVALVDLDTFYLDTPTFIVGALIAWTFSAAALVAAGQVAQIIAGVVIVVGIAVMFVVSNVLYRAVRGVDGMGLGDTIIVIATSGVPAALTGSITLGFWALLVGMIVAICVHLVATRGNLNDTRTPFAFGPYLAVGWPVAWLGALLFAGGT